MVQGTTIIKEMNVEEEGAVGNLMHFNSDQSSLILFTTQRGCLHSWDLRTSKEPFKYTVPPEFGSVVSTCHSPSKNGVWVCLGTSLGYLLLYDLRFNMLSGLWRISSHTPIMRMAASNTIPGVSAPGYLNPETPSDGAFLFVASGGNDCNIFSIPDGGEAVKCFRSQPLSFSHYDEYQESTQPLHSLITLSPHYKPPISPVVEDPRKAEVSSNHSVQAIMGRISHSTTSFLLTGGTDQQIRYWDFTSAAKCFTISGDLVGQPQSSYDSPSIPGAYGKLVICHEFSTSPQDLCLSSQLPQREERGIVPPSPGHTDTITDLKGIDLPLRMVLSSSRDGTIKGWR